MHNALHRPSPPQATITRLADTFVCIYGCDKHWHQRITCATTQCWHGTEKVRYTVKYVWYMSLNLVHHTSLVRSIEWHASSVCMRCSHECDISSHAAHRIRKHFHPGVCKLMGSIDRHSQQNLLFMMLVGRAKGYSNYILYWSQFWRIHCAYELFNRCL